MSPLANGLRAVLPVMAACYLLAPASARADPPATPASTAQPNVHVLATPFLIPQLNRERTVRVYLPPGYERSHRRYPVLYMHDGQNLFDVATAAFGTEWGVDETLNALARTRHLELIVVGVDNGAEHRVTELNAWDNAQFGAGEGEQYMAFIVTVLKPWVDGHYRTQSGRRHTVIMGSSMGGLISSYAIAHYPKVFGAAGIFSPAYWLAPPVFDDSRARPVPRDTRIYLYAGGSEDESMVPDLKRMAAALRAAGIRPGNLVVSVNPVGRHSEDSWRAEFPRAVEWLFRLSAARPPKPRTVAE